jgi:putative GTP pyrophosphokinase
MSGQTFRYSEIDRLRERLRKAVRDDDRRTLDAFRLSFAGSYATVIKIVHEQTSVEVSGRPAKSTTAMVEKLQRESIRLSQMQDVSGCRIVVSALAT